LINFFGYDHAYRYTPDEPDVYEARETYFPDGMAESDWYQPVPRKLDRKAGKG